MTMTSKLKGTLAVSVALAVALTASPAIPQTPKPAAKGTAKVEQKITPPKARYWIGAVTGSGAMAMADMAGGDDKMSARDAMRMATQGPPKDSRTVTLKLGSSLTSSAPEPDATHVFPAGAKLNKPVHLITPTVGPSTPTGPGASAPFAPKGQISFYWGCGETAPKGQPVVLTFDKLMSGDNDPELKTLDASVSARGVNTPSQDKSTTYGEWPHSDPKDKNKGLKFSFPAGTSLSGQHVIEGSYTPKIDFTLGPDQSFLDSVQYATKTVLPSGALQLAWNAVPRATGYSMAVMTFETMGDMNSNMIIWSSSNRPATYIVNQDLAPAEVERLIKLKAVLPPTTTTCTIPAEVMKATKMGSNLMFTGFGDQATFVYPPRPEDPKVTWEQEWFARVNFRADRMDPISPQGITDMSSMMGAAMAGAGAGGATPAAMTDEQYCQMIYAQQRAKPSVAEMAGGATGIPGGGMLGRALSGRGKKDEEAVRADPRCTTFKAPR